MAIIGGNPHKVAKPNSPWASGKPKSNKQLGLGYCRYNPKERFKAPEAPVFAGYVGSYADCPIHLVPEHKLALRESLDAREPDVSGCLEGPWTYDPQGYKRDAKTGGRLVNNPIGTHRELTERRKVTR